MYYSAQIFFGAEFTQVYANTLGSRIVPSENAVVADAGKAQEPGVARTMPLRAEKGAGPRHAAQTPAGVVPTRSAASTQRSA